MQMCPYKDGYECPWFSYGFNQCKNPDKKCLENGEKVLDRQRESCYNKVAIKKRR